ncbi:hypothetical protein NDU88_001864 [Pleurodeles waltl]|uniref:Uncharacterized protein n=1 Tax=Pleurodeles waltl TaxID=8319 RepID=A0AAV7P972_PLEWA|nr:hypothetical protein NDU88_001864 [Pleurodeles waltl]
MLPTDRAAAALLVQAKLAHKTTLEKLGALHRREVLARKHSEDDKVEVATRFGCIRGVSLLKRESSTLETRLRRGNGLRFQPTRDTSS